MTTWVFLLVVLPLVLAVAGCGTVEVKAPDGLYYGHTKHAMLEVER